MDFKIQVPEFHKVRMTGPGFHDEFMPKFMNHHKNKNRVKFNRKFYFSSHCMYEYLTTELMLTFTLLFKNRQTSVSAFLSYFCFPNYKNALCTLDKILGNRYFVLDHIFCDITILLPQVSLITHQMSSFA